MNTTEKAQVIQGPLDSKDLTRLSEAFSLLSDIYKATGWGEIDRGSVKWHSVPDHLFLRARRIEEEIKTIIQGPTVKDWAKGRRDVAVAFIRDETSILTLAAIEIFDRRSLGKMMIFNMSEETALASFTRFMNKVDGLLVSGPDQLDRAALGRLCAEAGVGRGKLEIIEAENRRKQQDYRNYLAGSFWINMKHPPESEIAAHALLTALQVRSTRKFAMTFYKQGFYTALAVSKAAADGQALSDISEKFSLPSSLVEGWASKSASFRKKASPEAPVTEVEPSSKVDEPEEAPAATDFRPASSKQISFVQAILKDLPWLASLLPIDWKSDNRAVSVFLSNLQEGAKLSDRRETGRNLLLARNLRFHLSQGEDLKAVARSLDITQIQAIAILEKDFRTDATALAADLAAIMKEPVEVETFRAG